MAYQVAKGNAPATGMPKSLPPDEITNVRSPTGAGYAMNGPAGNNPSVPNGKRVLSPLAANLESTIDDDALPQVIAKGTARNDAVTSQLRKIAPGNVPTHPAMSGAAKGPTIPSKIGAPAAAPVPGYGRKV